MSRNQLFRQEAVEYAKAKWLGKALLISGYSSRSVAALSLMFFILLLAIIIFGNYTRRINVNGEVLSQPHPITVFSPQQGFIIKKWVNAGDSVAKGQPLYQIDVSRTTSSGNVSATALKAINNQLTQIDGIIIKLQENKAVTLDNLRRQLEKYRANHQKSQTLVANAATGMEEMRNTMTNYTDYQRKGLINKDQLNNQRYLYYQQQSIYQSLNTQVIQEGLQMATLESELSTRSADFDNQISQYLYQRSDLQRQLAEADAGGMLYINAPSSGKIENMSVTQGQMVKANDSLAQLTPAGEHNYMLLLWLPNSSLPYVHAGDSVNIRYEAFPFEKFGQFPGRIASISNVPASPQEMALYNNIPQTASGGISEPYYKVMVTLKNDSFRYQGGPLTLSNGLKAQVTLFLEKRPLYQWMFSPFYDIRKSVMGPIDESNAL
ncbi:HlyD family secretion protein [Enterobacillus tribolii]|uniref:Membrane fusion protein n=1 Tax=Enterobacillus tribolii TaxID=1487935 RepID=A0A370R294_9GAMM|nr:HlyD family secretion protein [Enterobacillus tribolii]MBW7984845.1 HlyD family secretion protein [Enterobacillus tribolii]RDK96037.1 membrane fusion protein [Enterobacillus tribolii]